MAGRVAPKRRAHIHFAEAKRLKIDRDLCVDLRQGGNEDVDLFEMKAQQEAMVLRHAATKRLAQVLR